MSSTRLPSGFTMIEILVVIGIIGILASVVIIAINPTAQPEKARNARRRSDVTAVLNATYQYMIGNGSFPTAITTSTKYICKTSSASTCNGQGADLDVLTGSYIESLPIDPRASTSGTGTDYTIVLDSSGRITVCAPNTEPSTLSDICVTR